MSNVLELEWAQVDVFAERALEGNMLAIFPNAHGLSDAQMQALARETNLSETTFVFPGDSATDLKDGVRVRIFTTEEELPFAGHPTLGTASWLRGNVPAFAGADVVRLRLNAGTVPVEFAPQLAGDRGRYGTMHQLDPHFGALADADQLAAALSLGPADLHPGLPPQMVSTGLPFAIVVLRDVEALSRVAVNAAAVTDALRGTGASMAYCVAPTEDPAQWRSRMRFYGGEDPATGSAAGCAISYLVRHGAVAAGARTVFVQGVEMLRRSELTVSAQLDGDCVHDVKVGGRTIPVAAGRFILA